MDTAAPHNNSSSSSSSSISKTNCHQVTHRCRRCRCRCRSDVWLRPPTFAAGRKTHTHYGRVPLSLTAGSRRWRQSSRVKSSDIWLSRADVFAMIVSHPSQSVSQFRLPPMAAARPPARRNQTQRSVGGGHLNESLADKCKLCDLKKEAPPPSALSRNKHMQVLALQSKERLFNSTVVSTSAHSQITGAL